MRTHVMLPVTIWALSLDLGLDYSRWAWTVGLNIENLFENVFKNKILLKNSNIKNNVMDLFSIKVSSVYV